MSFFGGNRNPLDDEDKKKDPGHVSSTRLLVWIVVSAVALYLLGTGIYGIVTNGG